MNDAMVYQWCIDGVFVFLEWWSSRAIGELAGMIQYFLSVQSSSMRVDIYGTIVRNRRLHDYNGESTTENGAR